MRSRDVIKLLLADGWKEVAREGSHAQFKHPVKPGRVTVPDPKRDVPIGTLHSNIAYHLGLAYYLKGDYARAVDVYRRELADARNDDRRVSTAHWLYMSLRRMGRDAEAAAVLVPIRPQMTIVENETSNAPPTNVPSVDVPPTSSSTLFVMRTLALLTATSPAPPAKRVRSIVATVGATTIIENDVVLLLRTTLSSIVSVHVLVNTTVLVLSSVVLASSRIGVGAVAASQRTRPVPVAPVRAAPTRRRRAPAWTSNLRAIDWSWMAMPTSTARRPARCSAETSVTSA